MMAMVLLKSFCYCGGCGGGCGGGCCCCCGSGGVDGYLFFLRIDDGDGDGNLMVVDNGDAHG